MTNLSRLVSPACRGKHGSTSLEAVTSAGSHRLQEIDLLRFGAALSVVAYHYLFSAYEGGHSPLTFPAAAHVARYGYLGVDLFFVISGFVVLMTAWDRRPRSFIISRVARLYPAYWIAVSATALVSVVAGQGRYPVTGTQYLANLTMLNALVDVRNIDVVYWTLWAELRFYAIMLLLIFVGTTRLRVLAALWLWLGATALIQFAPLPSEATATADLVVQSQFSHYFIAGMALYLVHRFGASFQPLALLGLALANALYRGAAFAADVETRYGAVVDRAVVLTAICGIFLVMTLLALGVTRSAGIPGATWLGTLTYPLYLLHAHVGFICLTLLADDIPDWLLVTVLITGMCGLALAVHLTVERPLAPLLRRALGA